MSHFLNNRSEHIQHVSALAINVKLSRQYAKLRFKDSVVMLTIQPTRSPLPLISVNILIKTGVEHNTFPFLCLKQAEHSHNAF